MSPVAARNVPKSHKVKRPRGYTLLELLVVMTLLGLLTGLAWPAVGRWVTAARERGMASDARAALAGLPVRTFIAGRGQIYSAEQLGKVLGLPPEVRVRTAAPLAYSALGVASGGDVVLVLAGGRELRWVVAPVTGEVADAPPP
jgi:prepilin-type N-terminal cleavage/methylation domain-containing protein